MDSDKSRPSVYSIACKSVLLALITTGVGQADTWTGSINDLWSTNGNWLDGTAPLSADSVVVDGSDTSGISFVDTSFAVSGLDYIVDSSHTTTINSGSTLQVNNFIRLGNQNTTSDAGTAKGTLVLGSNSVLNVGTSTVPAFIELGWNQSGAAGSTATGVLNALDGEANLHLRWLDIGRSSGGQSATGTLLWDQAGAIDANFIHIGRGAGAMGTIDTPAGGTLRLGSETDPVRTLNIGFEDTGYAGVASGTLDLVTNNPFFEAVISDAVSLGHAGTPTGAGSANGTLVLGSNSVLTVGTPATRADINLGWNESNNAGSAATGVLNALDGVANLRLNELNIGRSTEGGSATGTLLWDQAGAIDARDIYIGRGAGAVGTIETPAGGTLRLGSAAAPVDWLFMGYDDNYITEGVVSGTLDLSTTNPFFEAVISNGMILGHAYAFNAPGSTADGTLVLGSNSVLNVGTTTTNKIATLILGSNDSYSGGGAAAGVLNAMDGVTNLRLDRLLIGYSKYRESASGIFTMGAGTTVDANIVGIGTGAGATGTVNMTDGLMIADTVNLEEGAFNLTGGRLAVNTFNGTLMQQGGIIAPGVAPPDNIQSVAGLTTVNGDYGLFSAGTLEIELMGLIPGSDFDQLIVNGGIDLNADAGGGGMLDILLGFAPSVGDAFTVIENDGVDSVSGIFFGLAEGALFEETFGGQLVTFDITYMGGTGNDIVLNVASVSTVPLPATVWLFTSGLLGLVRISRRKKLTSLTH